MLRVFENIGKKLCGFNKYISMLILKHQAFCRKFGKYKTARRQNHYVDFIVEIIWNFTFGTHFLNIHKHFLNILIFINSMLMTV